MPSETEFQGKQLTERIQQMELERLKRLQDFITGVIGARHEEGPQSSLLDQPPRQPSDKG